MKIVLGILILILLALVLLGTLAFVVFHHQEESAEFAVKVIAEWFLGVRPDIGDFKLDLPGHKIAIRDLKIPDPKGFPPEEKWMVQVPEISVTYDPACFSEKKIFLKELVMVIKEVTIVRDRNGQVNTDLLRIVRERKKKAQESGKAPGKSASKKSAKIPLKIDRLHLELQWVVYKDYTNGKEPSVEENRVLFDETFQNVTDLDALMRDMISRTLFSKATSTLAQYPLGLFAPAAPRSISSQSRENARILEELVRLFLPLNTDPDNGK